MNLRDSRRVCASLAMAALCLLLSGQPVASAAEAIPSGEGKAAPVIIDGIRLFKVFGVSDYPARQRAREIEQRITGLAQDPTFDPRLLEIREEGGLVQIYAGDLRLMIVLPEDSLVTGMVETQKRFIAKEFYLKKIVEAIDRYRQERTPEILRKHALSALLRTAILLVLLMAVFWLFGFLNRVLEGRFKKKIETLEAKSKRIIRFQHIWTGLKAFLRLFKVVLVLVTIYVFINSVLSLFPWTRHVSNTLLGYVVNPLLTMGSAFVDYLPNLFFLILLFLVVRFLLRLTRTLFSGIDRGNLKISGFEPEWAWPTYRIVRIVMIVMAVVVAYPYIPGSDSEAFKGISLLIGVLFSLGSTSLISNIIAGYTMTYRRAFKVGDRVKIGSHVGEVTNIRLLVTHMQSLKNEDVVIPNSLILAGEIVNYSALAAERGLILHTEVGIGYEVSWRQVEAMLLLAAERTQGLLKQPQPFVLQKALGDFAVTYELNAYCREAGQMVPYYSELHRNIQDVFNEYGVQIMTPHYMADTEEAKLVPRKDWYAPPAAPPQENDGPGGSQQ